jgi:hypothetical protein
MRIFYFLLSLSLLATIQVRSQEKPVSGQDPEVSIVRFYPNPATSAITFDVQKVSEKTYTLQIFNFMGKKVYETENINAKKIINLSDYNRGLYIYQLRDATGKVVQTGKFQVLK